MFFKKDLSVKSYLQRPASICHALIILFWFILSANTAFAQKTDTSGKITIHILNSKNGYYYNTDSGAYNKFVDSVIFMEGTDTLFCDSAVQHSVSKNFEAFGDVRIAQQDGTQATSDYLRYTAAQKLAYMSGNVKLTDGKNNLECAELTYDIVNKTGVYNNGGTLHNDSTTVTSNSGIYNVKTKEARFTGHAVIIDPEYKIRSEDLVYNTETKITQFYAKSTVTRDSGKSILQTRQGTYDGKNGIAHFLGHSTIWNDGQYIEGDSLYYNKHTGYGIGIGNVISIDTAHHSKLYCGRAEYFNKRKILWATIKPVLEQVNGKDTLYIRADTFYSAPMERLKPKTESDKPKPSAKKNRSKNETGDAGSIKNTDTLGGNKYDSVNRADTSKMNGGTGIQKKADKGKDFIGPPEYEYFAADTTKSPVKPDTVATSYTDTTRDNVTIKGKQKSDTDISGKQNLKKKTKGVKTVEETHWVVPEIKFRMPGSAYSDTGKKSLVTRKKPSKSLFPQYILTDTSIADTTAPQFFIGYHHVLIFSDSMQGKCDSICYTRSDSTIRMIYNPIVWSHKSQITGDTILMGLDSGGLRSMYVPNNAFVASQSGPVKAALFDQVQGRTLSAWFYNNTVDSMLVFPEAESIYYSKDDAGAYLGVNQANSVLMRIYFNDQKIKKIKFEKDVHQTMTPLEKADLPNTKLGRFQWLIDQRPKTKEELFD
jgi:lipopolysaccharide export system protein LptA